MVDFIELTEYDGRKILVNPDHIVKVIPDDKGAYLYFDATTGNGNSTSLSHVHVEESFAVVKRKLLQ